MASILPWFGGRKPAFRLGTRTMEATVIRKDGADYWSLPQRGSKSPETSAEITDTTAILNEIDNSLLSVSHAAAALIGSRAFPAIASADSPPREFLIAAPAQSERWVFPTPRSKREVGPVILTGVVLAAISLGWLVGTQFYCPSQGRKGLTGKEAVNEVVERIINAESSGDAHAKNRRSSATGSGQFLDETWLEVIRRARPDLTTGRSKNDILELRRDAPLVREITRRLAQQNAAILSQRGLPVTAGTLYLSHFAGAAGAVAILLAPENADAALVMANADASGQTTREKLIKANPFLGHITVANLKNWADRQMRDATSTGLKVGDAQWSDPSQPR